MYATLLLMSSTLGGDATPLPAGAVAGGCAGVPVAAACCDYGKHDRAGLLDRMRARHASKSSGGCCGTPAPAPQPPPVACCDPCASGGGHRSGLLDKIKGRCHPRKSADCCAADPCATPAVGAPVTPDTGIPPKEMPKPKDKAKVDEESASVPVIPTPSTVPAFPSARPREMGRRTEMYRHT